MEESKNLIPFEGKPIRKIWHNDEWYFSVVDVIEVLTDSPLPRQYWNKVKKTILKENQLYPFWIQLKLLSTDGKSYLIQARRLAAYLQAGLLVPTEEEALTVRATREALVKLEANPERLLG